MTPTTSAIVIRRVNLTSATLARMVCVRSETISTLIAGGSEDCSRGSALLIEVHRLDHVGAGLPLNLNQHRPLRVEPTGERLVFCRNHCTADIADPYGGSIPVGEDVVVKTARGHELVVGPQREGMLAAVERAFRLTDGADAEGGSHGFEVEPQRRELRRIDLDPDRRVCTPPTPTSPTPGICESFCARMLLA